MNIALFLIASSLTCLPPPGSCEGILDRYQNNAVQLIERIKNRVSLNGKPTKIQYVISIIVVF